MAKCRKCGTEIDENDKFCVYCGAKQEKGYEREEDKDDDTKYYEKENNDYKKEDKKHEDSLKDSDTFDFSSSHEQKRTDKKDKDQFTQELDNTPLKDKRPFNFKMIGIAILTIVVFVVAFKMISLLINKDSNKNVSNVGSKQNVSSDLNNNDENDTNNNSGEYVISYSNTRALTSNDLKGMSKKQLALARNEIFARHGYTFPTEPYKSYFASKSWYKPNPKYTNDGKELSALERHNVKVILIAEGRGKYVSPGYDADYYQ
jgi:predicted nucleic acid-binding Zn ribbon protein